MRRFAVLVIGALAAAIGIVSVAHGAGQAVELRKAVGSVSTGKGTPKGNRPAGITFTLATTRPTGPFGIPCVSFGNDCVLPNIAVHDDVSVPSGFKYNGGILKGNSQGKVRGAPAFAVCTGPDKAPKNGVPDLVESASGPGSKCKKIGSGSAVGYTHTCRSTLDDQATPNTQTAVGRKLNAVVSIYNGGGKANGNGGAVYGRLVVTNAQTGMVIAYGAIKVSFTGGKISFEIPDGLVKPFGACAPLTSTVLSLSRKIATVKRSVGGRVVSISRGLIESGPCKKPAKTWTFTNTVRFSTGASDPNTMKVIRSVNDPNVTTTTASTTVKCS